MFGDEFTSPQLSRKIAESFYPCRNPIPDPTRCLRQSRCKYAHGPAWDSLQDPCRPSVGPDREKPRPNVDPLGRIALCAAQNSLTRVISGGTNCVFNVQDRSLTKHRILTEDGPWQSSPFLGTILEEPTWKREECDHESCLRF